MVNEIIDSNGGNYNLPNYSKAHLAYQGLLPRCCLKPLNNPLFTMVIMVHDKITMTRTKDIDNDKASDIDDAVVIS